MIDVAGEHWAKFKVCGDLITLQSRTNEFVSLIGESFKTVTIQKSPSIGGFDVEIWIPNQHEVETVICFAKGISCLHNLQAKLVCEATLIQPN
jgi:hypothetical protein